MIKRLQQTPLTQSDIARLDVLLRRAVIRGTGREEYRAWCKLASYFVDEGYLSDLPAWLYQQAIGTFLNYRMADGRLAGQFANAGLSDTDLRKLFGCVFRAPKHAIAWPNFAEIIRVEADLNTPDQRIKRNAWRMLDHIMRRVPSVERGFATLQK